MPHDAGRMEQIIVPLSARPQVALDGAIFLSRVQRVFQALGLAMRRYRTAVVGLQIAVVVFYLLLLLIPAALPLPGEEARILDHITRFAQFAFWGVWWPFVILSSMVFGRLWCGVLCPEGAISEWASHRGLGRGVPHWMKWGGWPFAAFLSTTVFGQLVSVYEYPKAAALVLGGSTLVAVAVGLLYGRNKRVWCRYLCPASGVFALLAKVSPVHFRVDQKAWDAAPSGTRTSSKHAVNCAPLIDIRRMRPASACHMCGRCAGERNAVRLNLRSPNSELLRVRDEPVRWEIALLVFGILGVAVGAFQWSASPWFVEIKQQIATWLLDRDLMWPLQGNAPWWLLTHYPEKNEVFTWLDGALIVSYIGTTAAAVSAWSAGCLFAGARIAAMSAWRLAYALLPFAGLSAFIGLSALTVTLLRAEGFVLAWVNPLRAVLLGAGLLWSARLAWGLAPAGWIRKLAACGATLAASSAVLWLWIEMFYVW